MKIIFSEENIVFTKGFVKDFKKIELLDQDYIKQKIAEGFKDPKVLNIKKLKNYPYAQY